MAESYYSVGLDMGGTKCAAVLLDPESKVIATERVATPTGAQAVIESLTSVAKSLMAQSPEPVGAVGCGIPGLVTNQGVLRYAPHLANVTELPVADILTRELNVSVFVDNDNTCAAWGEYEVQSQHSSFCYVGFGTGIGGGFIVDGEIYRGVSGFAGEIGHMVVQANGPQCVCGRRGCWEVYASGNGLARLATQAGLDCDGPGIRELMRSGDQSAVEVVETFASWVAVGLANLVLAFDPGVIVLGGGAIGLPDQAGELIRPIWRHLTNQLGTSLGHRQLPDLQGARLGPQAGAIGAARLSLHQKALKGRTHGK